MNPNRIVLNQQIQFELSKDLKSELEVYEKKIYESSWQLNRIFELVDKIEKSVQDQNAAVFKIKIHKLKQLLKDIEDKKRYNKFEFDKIFNKIKDIQYPTQLDPCNERVQKHIEKISRNLIPYNYECIEEYGDNVYLTFQYNSMNFIMKNYPKRIIRNVERKKKRVRIENHYYDIFPVSDFGIKHRESLEMDRLFTNVLIVKVNNHFRCFHFDSLEGIIKLNTSSFERRLESIPKVLDNIKNYLRWKGRRYYYIQLEIDPEYESTPESSQISFSV